MTTITRYTKKVNRYLRNTCGVSALEYAILIGVIAVAIAAALGTLSDNVNTAIDSAATKVTAGNTEINKARSGLINSSGAR